MTVLLLFRFEYNFERCDDKKKSEYKFQTDNDRPHHRIVQIHEGISPPHSHAGVVEDMQGAEEKEMILFFGLIQYNKFDYIV
jgi:hypothetical protein